MDSTNWLVVVMVAIWVGGGFWVALRMGRTGHDLRLTLPMGLLLGPFLAWFATAPEPSVPAAESPRDRDDTLAILIGVDGSPQSISAARAAVEVLGTTITSITLATVLDYEDRGTHSGIPAQSAAYARLVDIAVDLGFAPTELELLYGAPAPAMAEYATGEAVDLIVVGARGQGLTQKLLGSVANELIGTSAVPVLVGPSQVVGAAMPKNGVVTAAAPTF